MLGGGLLGYPNPKPSTPRGQGSVKKAMRVVEKIKKRNGGKRVRGTWSKNGKNFGVFISLKMSSTQRCGLSAFVPNANKPYTCPMAGQTREDVHTKMLLVQMQGWWLNDFALLGKAM